MDTHRLREAICAHLSPEAKTRRITYTSGALLPSSRTCFINFTNLPFGIGRAGGGAEAENNRMMLRVVDVQATDGKVRVEESVSVFPRESRMRAKTAPAEKIAAYIAAHINKLVEKYPPNYTHTSPEELEAARQAWERGERCR